MRGWVKTYLDEFKIIGSDKDVKAKKVSWKRTPLSNLKRVELFHDNYYIAINGLGSFHQSDDFDVSFLSSESKLVSRRIEKKISKKDRYVVYEADEKTLKTWVTKSLKEVSLTNKNYTEIPESFIGYWLILELDPVYGIIKMSFKETRI